MIVKAALALALTPRNILAGFESTGICPFNPDIFTEADYIMYELSGENVTAEEEADPEVSRRISFEEGEIPEPGAHEEITTSETLDTSISSILDGIGPLQPALVQKNQQEVEKQWKARLAPRNVSWLKEKTQQRKAKRTLTKLEKRALKKQQNEENNARKQEEKKRQMEEKQRKKEETMQRKKDPCRKKNNKRKATS